MFEGGSYEQSGMRDSIQGQSNSFKRLLQLCTRLEPRSAGRTEISRFRPGLNYTFAARAGSSVLEAAELDATPAFVSDAQSAAAELWEGQDVGGFES